MFQRLTVLKNQLNEQKLDALLVTSHPNITYLTGYSNFSIVEREAFLIITKNNQYIITDARYSQALIKYVPHFTLLEITVKKKFEQILQDLIKKHSLKRIGFEKNNLTVLEHEKLTKKLNLVPTENVIEKLRTIKSSDEIKKIEQACRIGDKAFAYILPKIKTNISEKELAFEIEMFVKKQGFDLSFPSIVAFGSNASIPHHATSDQRLKTNSFVLLDFGIRFENYCSDMTRTVFFGKATAEQKRIYQTVLNAQQRAYSFLQFYSSSDPELVEGESRSKKYSSRLRSNNIKSSEIDKVAREYIVKEHYPSLPHSLGHGIGIEVHESPRLSPISKDELKAGMVFSLEPGIYINNELGIRIEDIVVLEQKVPRYLTHSPKNLIEI